MTTRTDQALSRIESMLADGLISEQECKELTEKMLNMRLSQNHDKSANNTALREKEIHIEPKENIPIIKTQWIIAVAAVLVVCLIGIRCSDYLLDKAIVKKIPLKSNEVVTDRIVQELKAKQVIQTAVPVQEDAAQTQAPTPAPVPKPLSLNIVNEGMYKVGSEIPAGEYMIIRDANGYGAYIALTKDSSGSLDSIITNENVDSFYIITISDGQYFEINGGVAVLFDDFVKTNPIIGLSETGEYLPGMYKVGVNLKAGEYKLTADPAGYGGYLEVSKNSSGSFDTIITNDNFDADKYITVRDGEYLKVSGATFRSVN